MTTLERLLQAVFGSSKFESSHPPIDEEKINQCLTRLPYSLSKSQRAAIFRTLTTDISYIQGPPGTGKTFLSQKLAQHLISRGDGFWELIQFHSAYTYEDFIQGIRPQSQDGKLTYPVVPGRFLHGGSGVLHFDFAFCQVAPQSALARSCNSRARASS